MSNQLREMQQIRRLFAVWISEIRLNNYESYYDINKAGEHLSRQLLNKIYNHDLTDLNEIKKDFPGLDLGDTTKDLVAYQVTSRTDCPKIIENLETVVRKNYYNVFTGGIRFLILNDSSTVKFGKRAKKTPAGILPTFNMDQDIIYPQSLIKKIEEIYEKDADLFRFNEIKAVLEKELIPIASRKKVEDPEINMDSLISLVTQVLDKLSDKTSQELNISKQFFYDDLKPPTITIASDRYELTEKLWKQIKDVGVLWLQGEPAMGKTSLAVLLTKKSTHEVLWIECRDIEIEQLMEHILSLLTGYLKIDITNSYKETLDSIFSAFASETFIVFNDLPNLQGHVAMQNQFGQFLANANVKDFNILITSNYPLSERLSTLSDLKIHVFPMPPFDEKDTEAVLLTLGAPGDSAALLSKLITQATEGHPLLIQSAAKFVNNSGWVVNEETVIRIFSGKFGEVTEREIYNRLLENTTDVATRELLYRLRCVIGEFSLETIQLISQINPTITYPSEKLNPIIDIWIQKNNEKYYQLSPLIKSLDGNLSLKIEKEINKQLGIEILKKKNISQIDASKAILYFSNAEEFDDAALVLAKVLFEFARTPQVFFDWGFNNYWFNSSLPESVHPVIKIQIRVFQISMCFELEKDITFLISDLHSILSKENSGMFGRALSEMVFFQVNLMTKPLAAFGHLAKTYEALSEIAGIIPEDETNINSLELLNGIWIVFSQLNKKKEYEEWFNILKTIRVPEDIIDPTNELYRIAAVSIYRNTVIKNKETDEDIEALLSWLIKTSEEYGLYLFCTYSLKYYVKFLIEENHDYFTANTLREGYEHIWVLNPIFKFIFYAEIGTQYFLGGNLDKANFYLSEIRSIELPKIYTEKVDYLTAYLQVAYLKKDDNAPFLAHEALKTVLNGSNYLLEDKVKLYGESAIGYINQENLIEALDSYERGYTFLLDNFNNNGEQQAIVIRYGNAVKYLEELFKWGKPRSFGAGKFVIPEPGYFYLTNDKLLADGFYFEERKFMVATILQSSFETIGNIEQAKRWAYKSIELSQELKNTKFSSVLLDNLHYLIQDKQYRYAYNLVSHIEDFYAGIKEGDKEQESFTEDMKTFLHKRKHDDLSIYFFILLPISFSFSIEICKGEVHSDHYKELIIDAVNSDKYQIKDSNSFVFAKLMFEKILIERISYSQMQELFKDYHGAMADILYIIGCLLLSSFTTATEAANLQLSIIIELDKSTKGFSSMYRFSVIPYFESFWKQKFITNADEFNSKDLLRTKGFTLIENADWKKKIQTIFRVFVNHLPLVPSSSISDFLDNDE